MTELVLVDNLRDLNRKTADFMSKMREEPSANDSEMTGDDGPRLIFPLYRGEGRERRRRRVSEQEARFAFCSVLNQQRHFYYAVECPTKELYSFSGGGHRSAQSDLTLFGPRLGRVANIEFKAHMPSQTCFSKDIQKLVREPCPGCWFHLLERTDAGTIPALVTHLKDAFLAAERAKGEETVSREKKFILITACVLDAKDPNEVHDWLLWGKTPADFARAAQDGLTLPPYSQRQSEG